MTTTADDIHLDKEGVKKKDLNGLNANVMPLIKEAENEDKDQGESHENNGELTNRGSYAQGRESGP